jgi:hypothetical protein
MDKEKVLYPSAEDLQKGGRVMGDAETIRQS